MRLRGSDKVPEEDAEHKELAAKKSSGAGALSLGVLEYWCDPLHRATCSYAPEHRSSFFQRRSAIKTFRNAAPPPSPSPTKSYIPTTLIFGIINFFLKKSVHEKTKLPGLSTMSYVFSPPLTASE